MNRYILFFFLFCTCNILAQNVANYDESKVPNYILPELLRCNDGTAVTTIAQWENKRKPELMEYFYSQEYGCTPSENISVKYQILAQNPKALDGKATSKQIKFSFVGNGKTVEALLLLYIPNAVQGKVPVVIGYNFKGNHSTTTEEDILYSSAYKELKKNDHSTWTRGEQVSRWSYNRIIDRGYAVATMWYENIYPDRPGLEERSVAALFSGYEANVDKPDKWQAIGAWAWGLSRIADYLETEEKIDLEKMAIMGHSRQGKATLWAGVQDERFKVVISNNSGCGGAALAKRVYGENIAIITKAFPHWFCPAFSRYADKEAELPFDQHQLIALIAPRSVYVASAVDDQWADPKGEFLSAYHAGPVYQLYGLKTLESDQFPAIDKPVVTPSVGYHIRTGGHDVKDYDWEKFLDFCDLNF